MAWARVGALVACSSDLLAASSRLHHPRREPRRPTCSWERFVWTFPVRARHLGFGRRRGKPRERSEIRADLQGVAGLLSGRALMAGMEHRERMRPRMSEPRFRVTSCTGFEIGTVALGASKGMPTKAWQVLDTANCFALVAEWTPTKRPTGYCEAQAREYATALNVWDAGACVGESPRIQVSPSSRPAYRREYQRQRRARLRAERGCG